MKPGPHPTPPALNRRKVWMGGWNVVERLLADALHEEGGQHSRTRVAAKLHNFRSACACIEGSCTW